MKLQQKIILISCLVAITGSVLMTISSGIRTGADIFFYFGIVAFFGGLLELVVGLIMLVREDKRLAQGLLMAAGILILVGFIACTATFSSSFSVH